MRRTVGDTRDILCDACGHDFEGEEHVEGTCPECNTPYAWVSSYGHDHVDFPFVVFGPCLAPFPDEGMAYVNGQWVPAEEEDK